MKIRKRKQAQEQQAKLLAVIPDRRPSSEEGHSLAKRMRSAKDVRVNLKEEDQSLNTNAASAIRSDDEYGNESELASAKDMTVCHSDNEEYPSDGGERSISYRSRTRTL